MYEDGQLSDECTHLISDYIENFPRKESYLSETDTDAKDDSDDIDINDDSDDTVNDDVDIDDNDEVDNNHQAKMMLMIIIMVASFLEGYALFSVQFLRG